MAAPARPATSVASAQSLLSRRLAEYRDARARLASVEASVAASAERLDRLEVRRAQLEDRLSERVASSYRIGPLAFISVLSGSATFQQFSSNWDMLARMNRQDAITLQELKAARRLTLKAARDLTGRQSQASRELRRLRALITQARKQLASSKAALATFNNTVAEQPANRRPAPVPKWRVAGEWKTALCSHYGPGSWGRRTADGTRIGPDSMLAAHKTLPFGTLVQFRYKGRTAIATIADRGPYSGRREFDLGPGVIEVLRFNGVDTVSYRILGR